MNKKYDVIVWGTGLKECMLSGLFSMSGKKFSILIEILTMEEIDLLLTFLHYLNYIKMDNKHQQNMEIIDNGM